MYLYILILMYYQCKIKKNSKIILLLKAMNKNLKLFFMYKKPGSSPSCIVGFECTSLYNIIRT